MCACVWFESGRLFGHIDISEDFRQTKLLRFTWKCLINWTRKFSFKSDQQTHNVDFRLRSERIYIINILSTNHSSNCKHNTFITSTAVSSIVLIYKSTRELAVNEKNGKLSQAIFASSHILQCVECVWGVGWHPIRQTWNSHVLCVDFNVTIPHSSSHFTSKYILIGWKRNGISTLEWEERKKNTVKDTQTCTH